jgi:hypothetical protein
MPDRPSFDEAFADVGKFFAEPANLLAEPGYSTEQKLTLLRQWEHDLRLLLIASDENMASHSPGQAGESLQAVHNAIAQLDDRDTKVSPAASKLGGG